MSLVVLMIPPSRSGWSGRYGNVCSNARTAHRTNGSFMVLQALCLNVTATEIGQTPRLIAGMFHKFCRNFSYKTPIGEGMKGGRKLLGIDRCATPRGFLHRYRCEEIIDVFHAAATIACYSRRIAPPFRPGHKARHGAC